MNWYLLKHICFYIISFTWGAIMTFIGLVGILVSLPFKRVHVFHGRFYAVWGKNWGGVSFGPFFFCGENSSDSLKAHEAGHGLQNCLWGPLFPFIIAVPSAIRYWYREYLTKVKKVKYSDLPPYDSIWFEGQATDWGKKYILTRGE